jgi:hypothetical protein
MTTVPAVDGLLQRLMLAIAYAWYAAETVRGLRPELIPERTDGGRRPMPSGART